MVSKEKDNADSTDINLGDCALEQNENIIEVAPDVVVEEDDVFTIRGHKVEIKDKSIIKYFYDQQEVDNLDLLAPHITIFTQHGIRIPRILHRDTVRRQLTLERLPFGTFPSMSDHFGSGKQDYLDPIFKIAKFRHLCELLGISQLAKQYPDNNDHNELIDFTNLQKTSDSASLIEGYLDEISRHASLMREIPRAIAHRDFSQSNIKTVPAIGLVMLDWSTFGVSSLGVDEGRWYAHHVLDNHCQRDILRAYQELNSNNLLCNLSFWITVGLRSARVYKMLHEGKYFDKHLHKEFPDSLERNAFRARLGNLLLDQLAFTIKNLEEIK